MMGALWKRRVLKPGLLLLLATAVCLQASRRPKLPYSLGAIAAQVGVGMSQDDVVALIRRCETEARDGNCKALAGVTRDGRSFEGYVDSALTNLPPADQVAEARLTLDDDRNRALIILLGPGGVVTDVRLESHSTWEEVRFSLANSIRRCGRAFWGRFTGSATAPADDPTKAGSPRRRLRRSLSRRRRN
ncbi:hypothetical protein FTUN_5192 [Frigoriglobus tundricola]|uniref:Uncharacterized protein n=1 Tax=Frigoriglobus tundricola TaxID=2774151 RepID=A0A6M5YU53_9BACT|nr:hypothetical protein FTUN_5192 [Frigoriglobus tundricola]